MRMLVDGRVYRSFGTEQRPTFASRARVGSVPASSA